MFIRRQYMPIDVKIQQQYAELADQCPGGVMPKTLSEKIFGTSNVTNIGDDLPSDIKDKLGKLLSLAMKEFVTTRYCTEYDTMKRVYIHTIQLVDTSTDAIVFERSIPETQLEYEARR